MSAGGSTRVIIFALLANLGIAVSKFVGAAISGSASLFAEAIHSLVDCTNQLLLLFAGKSARRAPTLKHPLGFGKEVFFWSFIVAILLFSMGGLFAIYEGIHKLHQPEPLSSPWLALGILLFGIVLESGSFLACLKEVRAQNRYGSLWNWFKNTTAAELLVIFTEDAAAILGLMIATVALLLAWLTGDSAWDARGSIVVGLLLVSVAALLAVEVKSLIIGEAPSIELRPAVERIVAENIPGGRVLRLIALQTGNAEIMLSYKVHPGEIREVAQLIDAINRIEVKVKEVVPEVRWQFVEPDTQD